MNARSAGRRQRGYTLVALLVGLTVMTVLIAAVLPLASSQAQREREAELIFRGTQIAEGIRSFRRRYGRYPTSLKEMIDVRPRTLRQLWKDPMTPSGEWALISIASDQVQPGSVALGPARGTPSVTPTPASTPTATPLQGGGLPSVGDKPLGPVMGVHSTLKKRGFRLYQGRANYDEWRFTEQSLAGGADGSGDVPAPGPGIGGDGGPARPPGGGGPPPSKL